MPSSGASQTTLTFCGLPDKRTYSSSQQKLEASTGPLAAGMSVNHVAVGKLTYRLCPKS